MQHNPMNAQRLHSDDMSFFYALYKAHLSHPSYAQIGTQQLRESRARVKPSV